MQLVSFFFAPYPRYELESETRRDLYDESQRSIAAMAAQQQEVVVALAESEAEVDGLKSALQVMCTLRGDGKIDRNNLNTHARTLHSTYCQSPFLWR